MIEKYALKTIPEDFFVKEIKNLENLEKGGDYSYYILRKKGLSTGEAIEKLSKSMHIERKYINFAGNKDKQAVTSQFISISKGPEKNLQLGNLSIEFIGKFKERINLGELEGNHFEITVRNIEKLPEIKNEFINYFDEQRFSKHNVEIGKLIIKKDFKRACQLINNKKINQFLEKNPNDFATAIKIEKNVVRICIHALQGYLWNRYSAEYIKENAKKIKEMDYSLGKLYFGEIKNRKIPIIGFGTDIDSKMRKLLKEEGISQRDFLIKSIPELSSEGSERELVVKAENIKTSDLIDDEIYKGKKKFVISFDLPKGSYATTFIKSLFL